METQVCIAEPPKLDLRELMETIYKLQAERAKHGDKIEILMEQYRFPRSRKKRIRRKWSNNIWNYRAVKFWGFMKADGIEL